MKKLLIATNVLLLGIILFQACNPATKPETPTTTHTAKANWYDDCLPDNLKIDTDTIFDAGGMDAHLAKDLSERYASDPYKGFMYDPIAKGKQDTKSIWFDLRRLKNLIETIEKSVCERDCKTPLRLGVRIYLAKYKPVTGDDAKDPGMRHIKKEYANRVTAFMVGTFDNAKGKHVDFDPMTVGPDKCHPISFKKLLDSLPRSVFNVNAVRLPRNEMYYKLDDTTAMNQGDLMPPPSGTGTFPTGGK